MRIYPTIWAVITPEQMEETGYELILECDCRQVWHINGICIITDAITGQILEMEAIVDGIIRGNIIDPYLPI